jgi:hypothetical protein
VFYCSWQFHDLQNHYQASEQKVKYLTQKEVEATVEEAKLRHALRAVMTEMEELDSEKTAEMQRAREQVPVCD